MNYVAAKIYHFYTELFKSDQQKINLKYQF